MTNQEQMVQLAANLAAIAAKNRAACKHIDRAIARECSIPSATRDKKTGRQIELERRLTLHDRLEEKPHLIALARKGDWFALLQAMS